MRFLELASPRANVRIKEELQTAIVPQVNVTENEYVEVIINKSLPILGFGVCCTFLATTCGSSVAQNCTYIQSPGYPSAYTTAGTCKYSIYPLSADICQLR